MTLKAGDIAVIAYNGDGNNDFAWVALVDIPAGETINFTDSSFEDTGFRQTEHLNVAGGGPLTWTHTSLVPAGTVIKFNGSPTPVTWSLGTAAGSFLNLAVAGDQIFAFQGSTGSPTFIYGTQFALGSTWKTSGSNSTNTSNLPPGLSTASPVTASYLSDFDNGYYSGTTTGTKAALLDAIADVANWTKRDSNGSNTDGSFAQANWPSSLNVIPTVQLAVSSNTGSEAGTTTITVTAQASNIVTGNQTLNLSITGTGLTSGDYTLTSSTITIPNGQSKGNVTLTIQDDALVEGTETAILTINSPSSGIALGATLTQTITITDNDSAGVMIAPTGGSTDLAEGGATDAYSIVLKTQPTANVTIAINSGTQATTNASTLTFTSVNWNIAQTVTVTAVDDAVVEGNHTQTISHTATSSDSDYNGISIDSVTANITDNDVAIAKIHDIQGTGSTAALTGTQTIEGIVTRTFLGSTKLKGFYVQEEDADADSDPATSEALFVYDPSGLFTGMVGDRVRISGTAGEYTSTSGGHTSSLTQLSGLTKVTIVNSGNSLPTATPVQLPVTAVSELERYEGMLVNLRAANGDLTVTDTFQLGRYGQVVLAADGATNQPGTDARLDQYTQFNQPSVAGYAAYQAEIAKRKLYLDDGSTVQNPDPIVFGRGGNPLSASNTLRLGDRVGSITGILDDRFEGYRLQTTTGVNFSPANPRSTTPPSVAGRLRVGSFNLLNYFNGDGLGGGFPTSRGASTATEFNRQRAKTIQGILGSGADVLGLMELENDGYGSTSAIQDLVNGLNAAAGAGTYTFVQPGLPAGASLASDQITVGLIYKPSKVSPVGPAATLTTSAAFNLAGRGPIAQTFRETATNEDFTVVVNHFKSKSSSAGGVGDGDAGDGQGFSNGTRNRQAQDLAAWLATKPTGTIDPDYLLIGDLNAYAQEDPLRTLASVGYASLLPNTSYSYGFDGQMGELDHGLASGALAAQVTGANVWHLNADEPSVLDYNTEFKSAAQVNSLYSAGADRASDHDPILIGLNLASPPGLAPDLTPDLAPDLTLGLAAGGIEGTNDDRSARLEISQPDGIGIPDGAIDPLRFDTTEGDSTSQTLIIRNPSSQTLSLLDLTLPRGFRLLDKLPDRIPAGGVVQVSLGLTGEPGDYGGSLVLKTDGSPQFYNFPLLGTIRPLTAEPVCACTSIAPLTIPATAQAQAGSTANDTLLGTPGSDFIAGYAGPDEILGGRGPDFLFGWRGDDRIFAGRGDDWVQGGAGDDFLSGDRGNDTVLGNGGNDRLLGDNHWAIEAAGQDLLCGGAGQDTIYGNRGGDTLAGGDDADVLFGGQEDDWLWGEGGDDWLWGDRGDNTLIGGPGADQFGLGPGTATILDFEPGVDRLVLPPGLGFADLAIAPADRFLIVAQGTAILARLVGWASQTLTPADFSPAS